MRVEHHLSSGPMPRFIPKLFDNPFPSMLGDIPFAMVRAPELSVKPHGPRPRHFGRGEVPVSINKTGGKQTVPIVTPSQKWWSEEGSRIAKMATSRPAKNKNSAEIAGSQTRSSKWQLMCLLITWNTSTTSSFPALSAIIF
jgi:hypothetical protein